MTEVAILAEDGDHSLKILKKSPFRIFAPTKERCQMPSGIDEIQGVAFLSKPYFFLYQGIIAASFKWRKEVGKSIV